MMTPLPVPAMSDTRPSQTLINLAIATLERLLTSEDTSTQDKITAACKILELSGELRTAQAALLANAARLSTATQTVPSEFPTPAQSISLEPDFIPATSVQIDNFLSPADYQAALDAALSRQDQFQASSTTTQAKDYRKSMILYSRAFSDVADYMRAKITHTLPRVWDEMGYLPFKVSSIEAQLTAHNDGCFYKKHTDASSEKTKTRLFTYVYYFYREPKAFTGGELKLYDTDVRGNNYINRDTHQLIEPRNNSIVFFNSRCKHEVLPIACPSRAFEDSRFTINGWVRR